MSRRWESHQIARVGTALATLVLIGCVGPSAAVGQEWATSRSDWANSSVWQLVGEPVNNGPDGMSSNWMKRIGCEPQNNSFGKALECVTVSDGGCLGQNPRLVCGGSIPAGRVINGLSELRYQMPAGEVDRLIGTDLRSYVGLELLVPDGIDPAFRQWRLSFLDRKLGEPRYETYRYYIGNIVVVALFYCDGESRVLKSWLIRDGGPNS